MDDAYVRQSSVTLATRRPHRGRNALSVSLVPAPRTYLAYDPPSNICGLSDGLWSGQGQGKEVSQGTTEVVSISGGGQASGGCSSLMGSGRAEFCNDVLPLHSHTHVHTHTHTVLPRLHTHCKNSFTALCRLVFTTSLDLDECKARMMLFLELSRGLNELIFGKCLDQCLEDSKPSNINFLLFLRPSRGEMTHPRPRG